MGLDMYLTKKIYVGANYEHNNVTGKINLKKGKDNKPIKVDIKKVTYIEESAGYWRKANQIHMWFVENIQKGVDDCGKYYVEIAQLKNLLSICKELKKKIILKKGAVTNGYTIEGGIKMPIVEEGKEIVNPEVAEELLPTASGFFFGNTDYDEYYMSDIDNTIEIIEALVNENDPEAEFYYQSSW